MNGKKKKEKRMNIQQKIIELKKQEATFQEIQFELDASKYELLAYYEAIINMPQGMLPWDVEFQIRQDYLKKINFLNLKEGKIIFISDTHISSKEENIEYLKLIKKFIQENNIAYLIHGGDIGDGMLNYASKYNTYPKQIEHILDVYLEDQNLFQYILGGNHDRKYQKKECDLLKALEKEKLNITGVGYYQAYFKIANKIISLQHKSNKANKLFTPDFTICGHTHQYFPKEKKITLPTLSDNFPNGKRQNNEPGFVVLTIQSNQQKTSLKFDHYNISTNGIEYQDQRQYTFPTEECSHTYTYQKKKNYNSHHKKYMRVNC